MAGTDIIGGGRSPLRELHTGNFPVRNVDLPHVTVPRTLPFITIATEAGIEVDELPGRLTEALNTQRSAGLRWTCWDHELVEKVAADNDMLPELIDSLESHSHSMVDEFLIALGGGTDDLRVFNRLASTVRVLAKNGGVVLVGHGSTFITRGIPGGIAVCLVAPLEVRIDRTTRRLDVSKRQAAARLRRIQRGRDKFIREFWRGVGLGPEHFAAMLNTAMLNTDQLVRAILALVPTA